MENSLLHWYYKFVDDHLPKANPLFSLLYLYALRFASQGQKIPNIAKMAENLRMVPSDVYAAWMFWVSQGLAQLNGEEIELVVPPQNEPSNPVDEQFNWLCTELETAFNGKISAKDIQTLMWLHKDQKINIYVLAMIIQYAKLNKRKSMGYVEKVALDWKQKGIDTPQKAEEILLKIETKKPVQAQKLTETIDEAMFKNMMKKRNE